MEQAIIKIVFLVHLINGQQISHQYTPNSKLNKEEIYNLLDRIFAAMSGQLSCLLLDNPSVVYNSKHIIGIQIEGITEAHIQSMQKEMNKRMGFCQV